MNQHPAPADADYAVIPEVLSDPDAVLEGRVCHVLLLRRSGRIFVGVVKATRKRDNTYLVSLRIAKGKSLMHRIRTNRIVSGDASNLGK